MGLNLFLYMSSLLIYNSIDLYYEIIFFNVVIYTWLIPA